MAYQIGDYQVSKEGILSGSDSDEAEQLTTELSSRGFEVDMDSAKYLPDGSIRVVYLKKEFAGFAVHLIKSQA